MRWYLIVLGPGVVMLLGLIPLIIHYESRRKRRIAQGLPLEETETPGFEVDVSKRNEPDR
jgi:hypothetical protein